MIVIGSDVLRVELAEPGEAPNNTSRFDRAGFITEVVLNGIHRFCASEPNNLSHPSSGGRGLCSELLFDVSEHAMVNGYFPKLGIGLMQKPSEEKYIFYEKYINQPFPVTVEQTGDSIAFCTESINCMGYAVREKKTIKISNNQLVMTIGLENVGDLDIQGNEYCHNFLSLNGMAIGPGYRLLLPDISSSSRISKNIVYDSNELLFRKYDNQASIIYFEQEDICEKESFEWTLLNRDAKAAVECSEEFKPTRCIIWAADHIVSPEVWHGFMLKPGQSDMWIRKWTFLEI